MAENFDCLIIGGSYAGLSAALALGRSLRTVLIVDDDRPANRNVVMAHNLLMHDGTSPRELHQRALEDVMKYPSISTVLDRVTEVEKDKKQFRFTTLSGYSGMATSVLMATGVVDILPSIPGFADCWGITAVHCPYCHGYEFRERPAAIVANGDGAVGFAKTLLNWTSNILILTNGKSTIASRDQKWLAEKGVKIEEDEVSAILHTNGKIDSVQTAEGRVHHLDVLFHNPEIRLPGDLANQLGCKINEHGLLEVDVFQATSVDGVYAAGDSSTTGRSLAQSIATGSVAGIFINKWLNECLEG